MALVLTWLVDSLKVLPMVQQPLLSLRQLWQKVLLVELKAFLGIKSPSRVFKRIGRYVMKVSLWDDNTGLVMDGYQHGQINS